MQHSVVVALLVLHHAELDLLVLELAGSEPPELRFFGLALFVLTIVVVADMDVDVRANRSPFHTSFSKFTRGSEEDKHKKWIDTSSLCSAREEFPKMNQK